MGFLSVFKKAYLLQYNVVQTVGWTFILFLIGEHYFTGGTHQNLWPKIQFPLMIFQTMAALEIFHAALGIVRSDVATTFLQIFSRILLADIVAPFVPEAQRSWLVTTMVVSWCLVEMIRYPYYALGVMEIKPPAWLGWLRYSAFYILYPTGGSSEALMIYVALPWFKATGWGSIELPNSHNFAWSSYWFLAIFSSSYIFGLPMMMLHMVAQRKAFFRKQQEVAQAKKTQ